MNGLYPQRIFLLFYIELWADLTNLDSLINVILMGNKKGNENFRRNWKFYRCKILWRNTNLAHEIWEASRILQNKWSDFHQIFPLEYQKILKYEMSIISLLERIQ